MNEKEQKLDEKTEAWAEEYVPHVSRRGALKIGGATAGAVAVGTSPYPAHMSSHGGTAEAAVLLPLIPPAAKYGAAALGLSAVVGAGWRAGNRVVDGVIDRVFGFMEDDTSSVVEEEDELTTAHIHISAQAQNIMHYQERVLTGTRDQKQLTANDAIAESTIQGLEARDAGAGSAEAQAEAQAHVNYYYNRLLNIIVNDADSVVIKNGGLWDAVRLDREYDEPDKSYISISAGGTPHGDFETFAEWDNLQNYLDGEGLDWDEDINLSGEETEKVSEHPETGGIRFTLEGIAGEEFEMHTIVSIDGTTAYIFQPDKVPPTYNYVGFEDSEGETFPVINMDYWGNLWNDIIEQRDNIFNLVGAAVADAYAADIDTQSMLNALNSTQVKGNPEEDIEALSTAFVSLFADANTNPLDNKVVIDGDAETDDGTVEIDDPDGGTVVVTDPDDTTEKWVAGETYSSGGRHYYVTSAGDIVPLAGDYTVTDIQEVQRDEDGEVIIDEETGEPVTESKTEVDKDSKDLQTEDIEFMQEQVDIVNAHREAIEDLIEQLEEGADGSSGGLFDSGGMPILALLAGVIIALLYGQRQGSGPGYRRGRY